MNKVLWSRKSDHWSTPEDFKNSLGVFDFDPCPLNATFDGLLLSWKGRVFVNPPYSNIRAFIEKACVELAKGNCKEVVILVPSRTDTKWFHDLVIRYNFGIQFLKGRLKFGGSKNSAPFPSMVLFLR